MGQRRTSARSASAQRRGSTASLESRTTRCVASIRSHPRQVACSVGRLRATTHRAWWAGWVGCHAYLLSFRVIHPEITRWECCGVLPCCLLLGTARKAGCSILSLRMCQYKADKLRRCCGVPTDCRFCVALCTGAIGQTLYTLSTCGYIHTILYMAYTHKYLACMISDSRDSERLHDLQPLQVSHRTDYISPAW